MQTLFAHLRPQHPNICWHDPGSRRCHKRHGDRVLVLYGRARSGRRWFWAGWTFREENRVRFEGHADSEESAFAALYAAIVRLADSSNQEVIAVYSAGVASDRLKDINREKRLSRPAPDGADSEIVEYIYNHRGEQFRITKKTRARIFYVNDEEERDRLPPEYYLSFGFVDRRLVLEKWPDTKEEFWNSDRVIMRGRMRKSGRAREYTYYSCFWLEPMPDRLKHRHGDDMPIPDTKQLKANIKQLKAAAAAVHPDKGGSNEAFREAYKRYEDARDRLKLMMKKQERTAVKEDA